MKILVEEEAFNYSLTQEIINKGSYQVIRSYEEFFKIPSPIFFYNSLPQLISEGKKLLFIMKFKGRFFRPCPGTKNYVCCGYKIFHFAEGCPLDCSYCILQLYLNRPGLKIWGNLLEDGFSELEKILEASKKENKVLRIGTGEFTDSMALEPYGGVSAKLIDFWSKKDPLAVLELKTKISISEDFYSKLKPDPRVIFAWSVNTPKIIETEEKGTASLERRLESAKKAVAYGFTVAFHFDPIILYEEAEKDYPEVLQKILDSIPLDKIAWISLGTLRYPKELKFIAQKRFPKIKIFSYEFIDGLDKKRRYFIDLRKKLYKNLLNLIKITEGQVTFYFCMETERVWQEILKKEIKTSEELASLLDKVAYRLCSQI